MVFDQPGTWSNTVIWGSNTVGTSNGNTVIWGSNSGMTEDNVAFQPVDANVVKGLTFGAAVVVPR